MLEFINQIILPKHYVPEKAYLVHDIPSIGFITSMDQDITQATFVLKLKWVPAEVVKKFNPIIINYSMALCLNQSKKRHRKMYATMSSLITQAAHSNM